MRKIINFLKSVVEEIKKVEWLSKRELLKHGTLVILFTIFSTIFIAIVDIVFIEARTIAVNCLNDSQPGNCVVESLRNNESEIEAPSEEVVIDEEATDTGEVLEPTPEVSEN